MCHTPVFSLEAHIMAFTSRNRK